MSRPELYRQCSLSRTQGAVRELAVTWLPERYAVLGDVLRLLTPTGWEDGYLVDVVGEEPRDLSGIPDAPRVFRRHKRGTGDSLGRETAWP